MKQIPQENFQYAHLNRRTRAIVWQRTSEIKSLMRLTAENIISIGRKLIEVKEQLEHGSFQSWLQSEFEWSEQTARQFMQVYRWSQTIENKNFVFSQLATSALYLLAAPSTSPKARTEILHLIEVGEKVTYTRARDIVDRYKQLALPPENKLKKVVNVEVKKGTEQKLKFNSNQLFRLETEKVGCIVRLYRGNELCSDHKLTVGSQVTIETGSLQGQTAKIIEVLTDLQSSDTARKSMVQVDLAAKPDQSDMVHTVEGIDCKTRQALRKSERHLVISYGEVDLSVEANSKTLATFVKQIQANSAFVEKMFELAHEQIKELDN